MTSPAQASAPTYDNRVATEVINQLGGNKFVAMTGARDFVYDSNSITFRLPARMSKGTHVRITLTGRDDYTIELFRIKAYAPDIVGKSEGVMCDNLRRAFTEVTGLATSL